MILRQCQFQDCNIVFEPKTHNQKYHSDECCRLATNKRIMERYYERKARRKGGRRVCSEAGCGTILNRYNDSEICGGCLSRKDSQNKAALASIIQGVTG